MKIIDLATFLTMPAGTLYAKYEPCIYGELQIKDETCATTWWYQELVPWFKTVSDSLQQLDMMDAVQSGEASPPLDYDSTGKDGLYEGDQLFAVFERTDAEALIARMRQALNDGYGKDQHATIGAAAVEGMREPGFYWVLPIFDVDGEADSWHQKDQPAYWDGAIWTMLGVEDEAWQPIWVGERISHDRAV